MRNRILIVDDVAVNRMILSGILGEEYDIIEASNGVEAIALLVSLTHMPDVILLDSIMPEMDGFTTIRYLKSNQLTHDIPIVFVTALNNVDDERKGLLMGADDYINKPFDPFIVKLRVDIQMRMINQLKKIKLLSAEVESWMKSSG